MLAGYTRRVNGAVVPAQRRHKDGAITIKLVSRKPRFLRATRLFGHDAVAESAPDYQVRIERSEYDTDNDDRNRNGATSSQSASTKRATKKQQAALQARKNAAIARALTRVIAAGAPRGADVNAAETEEEENASWWLRHGSLDEPGVNNGAAGADPLVSADEAFQEVTTPPQLNGSVRAASAASAARRRRERRRADTNSTSSDWDSNDTPSFPGRATVLDTPSSVTTLDTPRGSETTASYSPPHMPAGYSGAGVLQPMAPIPRRFKSLRLGGRAIPTTVWPDLYVAPSTVRDADGVAIGGLGVFTRTDIPRKNMLVALYTGRVLRGAAVAEAEFSDYRMASTDDQSLREGMVHTVLDASAPDACIARYINDNVTLQYVPRTQTYKVVKGSRPNVRSLIIDTVNTPHGDSVRVRGEAVGIYTLRPIHAGEELFIAYGKGYWQQPPAVARV